MRLAEMTWPQAEAYFREHDTVLIALGSTECHGRHMPLGTDWLIPDKILEVLEPLTDALIAPDSYEKNMEQLVMALRNSLDPDLKIFDAEIADNPNFWVWPHVVNQAKQNLADRMPGYYLFDTNDAGFSTDNEPVGNPDRAHYDAHWELVLGRWFGESIAAAL